MLDSPTFWIVVIAIIVFFYWRRRKRKALKQQPWKPTIIGSPPPQSFEEEQRQYDIGQPIEDLDLPYTKGATLRIKYVDADGNVTVRDISNIDYRSGSLAHPSMQAWCHMREDDRNFRYDRVLEALDIKTGEFLSEIRGHPIGTSRKARVYQATKKPPRALQTAYSVYQSYKTRLRDDGWYVVYEETESREAVLLYKFHDDGTLHDAESVILAYEAIIYEHEIDANGNRVRIISNRRRERPWHVGGRTRWKRPDHAIEAFLEGAEAGAPSADASISQSSGPWS